MLGKNAFWWMIRISVFVLKHGRYLTCLKEGSWAGDGDTGYDPFHPIEDHSLCVIGDTLLFQNAPGFVTNSCASRAWCIHVGLPLPPVTVVVELLGHFQLFCDPVDCSPPGSSVHGISQARTLEWAAISSSRGPSWPREQNCVSCAAGRSFTTEPWGSPCLL